MHRLLFAVACCLLVETVYHHSLSARESQAVSDDLARLDGTWQIVYDENDGKTTPGEQIATIQVVFKDGNYTVKSAGKPDVPGGRFMIDPTARPRTMDDTVSEGPDKGRPIHGIYELGDDTLATCVAAPDQPRPEKFSTTPGSVHAFRVLKRVRPGEDPRQKAIRDELIRFGGTWRFTTLKINGAEVPADNFQTNRLVLQGDRFLATDATETASGIFKLDPTRVPKTIDVIFTSGSPKGTTVLGIYELTGDTYKTCINPEGQPRPEKFESKPGTKYALELLTRDKP